MLCFRSTWQYQLDRSLMDRPSRHCTYRSSRRPWGHDGTGIGAGLVLAGLVLLAVFAAEIAAVVLMVR
jgi:hypothetical protein